MDVLAVQGVLQELGVKVGGLRISGRVCCDSRAVEAGDVFVAVRGENVDGHEFVSEAVRRGARVVVSERAVETGGDVSSVVVEDSAAALGQLAQGSYGWPGREMKVLGVTGTNGKTTVAYLVRAMVNEAGIGCGMVGTVEYDVGGGAAIDANNTTPDALRLAKMMRQMRDNGLGAMMMECSSHGLSQRRIAGIDFDAAAFTNLSGDHLDYHGNEQNYRQAKSRLFAGLSGRAAAVLNASDPVSEFMASVSGGKIWWYGVDEKADISGRVIERSIAGTVLELKAGGEAAVGRLGLPGDYNVSNCLAAVGLARAAGVDMATIGRAIDKFAGVPGRLEKVECPAGFTVLVDYAHTDDGLNKVLETVRGLCQGRVILVFGCGGQRDKTKRPRMAAVAEKWADVITVTDDNPRNEDAQEIRSQIKAGFSAAGLKKMKEIGCRAEAISYAIKAARQGDVVLIAGKGHENYQLVGRERFDFDDREVARGIMNSE